MRAFAGGRTRRWERRIRTLRWAALALTLVLGWPAPAGAAPGLDIEGGEGFLLLPAAQALPPSGFGMVTYAGLAARPGEGQLGVGPLAVATGLPPTLELALSVRENGMARDDVRAGATTRLRLKVMVVPPTESSPAVALEAHADHLLAGVSPGGRLLVSRYAGNLRVGIGAGYHLGWRDRLGAGPELGAAIAFLPTSGLELVAEGSAEGSAPWGVLAALGARWRMTRYATLSVIVSSAITGPAGTRVAVGLNLRSDEIERATPPPPPAPPPMTRMAGERPRFRMKVRQVDPSTATYRPLAPEADGVEDVTTARDGP